MKNRTALRAYFLSNSIPTEANFHELINSSLNQEEDGVRRAVNGPVELEAQGTAGEMLHLYGSFKDSVALWKIGHKPALAGAAGTAGLNIADAQASRLFIKAGDGSVGIGTDAPAKTLDVVGSIGLRNGAAAWDHLYLHHDGGTAFMSAGGAESGLAFRVGNATTGSYDATNQNYKEGMRLLPNGNVGIGTTAPNSRLSISPNAVEAKITLWDGNNTTNHYGFGISDSQFNYHVAGTGARHVFYAGGKNGDGTELMRIQGNGSVGIGTNTPSSKLTVQLSNDGDQGLRVTDGTNNSNIVIQPLAGGNSGFQAINFNGFFSGGEQRFNTTKNRWRVGVDHRVNADYFFIDSHPDPVTFIINSKGNVGIGTSSPIAKLHVKGGPGAAEVTGTGLSYFGQGGDFAKVPRAGGTSRPMAAYFESGSLWVNGDIGAGALNVNSDRRIKHVVGQSDCAADLDLLKKIRVTDYTYIDKLANTDREMKKVIAQEIQVLLPAAVNTSTQALPNVYEQADRVSFANGRVTVTTTKAHELPTSGGKMRLYTVANEDVNADATVVDAHTFSFASDKAYEAGLFVYGKFVDDFLSVDYDAVAMLNVSATQALAQQVAELHQQNAALNEQCRAQGTQLDELRAAVPLLQQQVAGLLSQPMGVAQPA